MKHIVVTGANGFVGSFLVNMLEEKGFGMKALVRTGSNANLITDKSVIENIDYQDLEQLESIISNADILIHCAALTKARTEAEYAKVNVGLTKTLVELANKSEKKVQFIQLSTQAAAGMAPKGSLKKESDSCSPLTYYGKTKLQAEEFIQAHCKKPWTIIRPVSVYGPGDKDFLEYFKMVKSHLGLVIGKKKLANFVSVEELCKFILLTIDNPKAYNEIFFANDGKAYFQEDFVDTLSEVLKGYMFKIHVPELLLYPIAMISEMISFFTNKPVLINMQKVKEFRGDNWLCSIEKARDLLDYKPNPNLKKNIEITLKWYKENRWL